ncbi:Cytochrome oxidase assembly factor 4 [Pseudocercospora fuligena]|uniref:Cytochrome oxidase assembly factor 4 n=1 Tax=Pseudocercospora fuligena TaxID=685502 RepID=A0A8H6RCW2_9PEZI|nr:Cytochrome oxidase assembly factor 4 [Pseudocercospora fuligena]
MSNSEKDQAAAAQAEDDDEPDEWDKRIFSTGCADENATLNDCFRDKKDWRACKDEIAQTTDCGSQMESFKQCWKRQGNDERTDQKDA